MGRVSSKLRLLGIFKVRLRIPSEVRTLSRLRGGYKAECFVSEGVYIPSESRRTMYAGNILREKF